MALTWLRTAALCVALGCLAASPLLAQTPPGASSVALSLPEARALARQALDQGAPELATSIATALLTKDRADVSAWLLLSAAEGRQGHAAAGVAAGRRAFALSGTPETRFEAAYLTGLAHASGGQDLRAKLWLRRATEYAPDPALRAAAAQRYRTVASQARTSVGLSLHLGPSDNVNGGSLHDTFYVIGIPLPIEEALPGGVYGGSVTLRYRLAASATGITEVFASAQHRGAWLSDTAKAMQPRAKASDYAVSSLDVGISRRWKPGAAPLVLSLSGSAGKQWYGGSHLSDRLSGELRLDRLLSETRHLQFSLVAERVMQPDTPLRNADTLAGTATLQQGLGPDLGVLSLSLGLRDTRSDAASVAHSAVIGRVGWQPARMVKGIAAELGLGLELRDYSKAATPRPDRRVDADLALTFTEADYMGFSPRVNLRVSRTFSDFVLRDSRDVSVGLGLRSAF